MKIIFILITLLMATAASAQMKTIDGTTFYLEDASDGGMVVGTLVPQADGSYLAYRHWYSVPSEARAAFDALNPTKAAERAATALEQGVTGRIQRPAMDALKSEVDALRAEVEALKAR